MANGHMSQLDPTVIHTALDQLAHGVDHGAAGSGGC